MLTSIAANHAKGKSAEDTILPLTQRALPQPKK